MTSLATGDRQQRRNIHSCIG